MNRYKITGLANVAVAWKIESDPRGELVLWRDVETLVARCAELAAERDKYRQALGTIARIPMSLPNSAAGVRKAQQALDQLPKVQRPASEVKDRGGVDAPYRRDWKGPR